jgi:hypothetical protein
LLADHEQAVGREADARGTDLDDRIGGWIETGGL